MGGLREMGRGMLRPVGAALRLPQRGLRALAAMLMAAALLPAAQAQDAPRLTIVVGFPPGGGVDIVGRLVADRLAVLLARPVIVENRPGASSGVATRYIAQAKADGNIIFVNSNSMLVNQLINPEAGYDVERDLAPIGKYVGQPNLLAAAPDLPVSNLAEVVALSKTRDITFSSPGTGSIPHLAAEQLLNVLAGAKVRHIPYPGSAPALASVMGSQVQLASVSAPTAVAMVQGGKLKAIVVTSANRMAALPQVPTVIESGYPGFVVDTWAGFFVPAATPRAVIDKLDAAISKVIAEPEMKQKLIAQGFDINHLKPDEFRKDLGEEMKRWRSLLTRITLK
ncbi:MAG TPA: tripartite tricarboxylate transporter substrate-binding protein [Burkholderiales bacterium]|jgi:tripartite-type tricarboxylate transporter receptor subunit TctC|nr:tripartite tricarboxylate transporter substrate-binding protein [Burkholderiales bacterium]